MTLGAGLETCDPFSRNGTTFRKYPSRESGITLIELLIVIAILAIIFGIGIFNARGALESRQESAAIKTVSQMVWQGATAASARGRIVTLNRDGHTLRLLDGDSVIREDDLPRGVSTNLPGGTVLVFSPPGKITDESLSALLDSSPWIRTSDTLYDLEVSLIGEVRAVAR